MAHIGFDKTCAVTFGVCNSVYFSTTSEADLSELGDGLFLIETVDENNETLKLLGHPNRWYVACRYGGCSCHYRHATEGDLPMFRVPEDWCPEDEDDIESTAAFYDFLSKLLGEGHKVDVVDIWEGTHNAM